MDIMLNEKLLPAGQMARRLRVTVRWLKAEVDAGRVPAIKAEKRYLFNPDAVIDVLAQRAAARPGQEVGDCEQSQAAAR